MLAMDIDICMYCGAESLRSCFLDVKDIFAAVVDRQLSSPFLSVSLSLSLSLALTHSLSLSLTISLSLSLSLSLFLSLSLSFSLHTLSLTNKKLNIGEFVMVKITKAYDYDLEGELVG